MKNTHARDAQIFKALCDEKRLSILELLREGEKCACVLIDTTSIAQSALSYHMKILTEAGIISCRHDGKFCHYSLDKAGCEYAMARLSFITRGSADIHKHEISVASSDCGCKIAETVTC